MSVVTVYQCCMEHPGDETEKIERGVEAIYAWSERRRLYIDNSAATDITWFYPP